MKTQSSSQPNLVYEEIIHLLYTIFQGDSGSYVGSRTGRGSRSRMEVNGLVSFGARSSCEKKYPMGLTDIYTYNSWIVGVVGKYDKKELSEISSFVS